MHLYTRLISKKPVPNANLGHAYGVQAGDLIVGRTQFSYFGEPQRSC